MLTEMRVQQQINVIAGQGIFGIPLKLCAVWIVGAIPMGTETLGQQQIRVIV